MKNELYINEKPVIIISGDWKTCKVESYHGKLSSRAIRSAATKARKEFGKNGWADPVQFLSDGVGGPLGLSMEDGHMCKWMWSMEEGSRFCEEYDSVDEFINEVFGKY